MLAEGQKFDGQEMTEWRIIPDLPDYKISEYGNVMRITRGRGTWPGKILKPIRHKRGYSKHNLSCNGIIWSGCAHRLVALAFIGPPPSEQHEIAHNDGDTSNNHFTNLRWATRKENHSDKKEHGTWQAGEKCGRSKLTEKEVLKIRRLCQEHQMSHAEIAGCFNIGRTAVTAIHNRTNWGHL